MIYNRRSLFKLCEKLKYAEDVAVPIFECPLRPFKDVSLFNIRLDGGFEQPDST